MTQASPHPIPDFEEVFRTLLDPIEVEHRPLLVAMLERVAAAKYREWAALPECAAYREALLECGRREEEIAANTEALYPEAPAIVDAIAAANPQLAQVPQALFGDRPVLQQIAILMAGERAGGHQWIRFAQRADSDRARSVFTSNAAMEEVNAGVLQGIVARPGDRG